MSKPKEYIVSIEPNDDGTVDITTNLRVYCGCYPTACNVDDLVDGSQVMEQVIIKATTLVDEG